MQESNIVSLSDLVRVLLASSLGGPLESIEKACEDSPDELAMIARERNRYAMQELAKARERASVYVNNSGE